MGNSDPHSCSKGMLMVLEARVRLVGVEYASGSFKDSIKLGRWRTLWLYDRRLERRRCKICVRNWGENLGHCEKHRFPGIWEVHMLHVSTLTSNCVHSPGIRRQFLKVGQDRSYSNIES